MEKISARLVTIFGLGALFSGAILSAVLFAAAAIYLVLQPNVGAAAAAALTSVVVAIFPAVAFVVYAPKGQGLIEPKRADLMSKLTPLLSTAALAVAARRPLTTLGLAALAGAVLTTFAANSDGKA